MKKIFFLLVIASSFALTSGAQSKLIHFWHFNTFTGSYDPVTASGVFVKANYSTIDTNKATVGYRKLTGSTTADTTKLDYYTIASDTTRQYDTLNARFGVMDGNAFRTRNPSSRMEVVFFMPTTKYKNIVVKYATQASNGGSGQKRQLFDYSVDSGITWRTSGLSKPSDSASWPLFKLVTVSFSDTQVNDNPKFVFRIRFDGQNTGSSGNNRFDNISLDGDTVTTTTPPSSVNTISGQVAAFTIAPVPAHNEVVVNSTSVIRAIEIADLNGKSIISISATEKRVPVDVSSLSNGTYIVTVTDEQGRRNTQKFIKE